MKDELNDILNRGEPNTLLTRRWATFTNTIPPGDESVWLDCMTIGDDNYDDIEDFSLAMTYVIEMLSAINPDADPFTLTAKMIRLMFTFGHVCGSQDAVGVTSQALTGDPDTFTLVVDDAGGPPQVMWPDELPPDIAERLNKKSKPNGPLH